MNGILAGIVGVWALCQVFGGDALERLGVLRGGSSTTPPPANHDTLPPGDFGPDGLLKL